jgi:hypothetical protein
MSLDDIQQQLDMHLGTELTRENFEKLRNLVGALTEQVTKLSDDLRYAHDRLDAAESKLGVSL